MDRSTDFNRVTGIRTDYTAEDEKMHITVSQSVGDYLRFAEQKRNEHRNYKNINHGFYHRAKVPLAEVFRWKRDLGVDWYTCSEEEREKFKQTADFKKWELV